MLKQEQSRSYTPDILPRSKTIQDLSVFISALAAVGPGEGNHAICNQGRKVLERILDRILSPDQHTSYSGGVEGGGPGEQDAEVAQNGLGDPALYFPTGNDAEFVQWLENIEWERGSLLNQ